MPVRRCSIARLCGLTALATVAATATPARSQCTARWIPGHDAPAMALDGPVYAFTEWDPDGPGTRPPLLIAAGEFLLAGGSPAFMIGAWDGVEWAPLGGGFDIPPQALAVFQGDLIVGGYFSAAGGPAGAGGVPANNIARWNGSAWQPLGNGVSDIVLAMAVYNNELIVAGDFDFAGGAPARKIARWNGTAWAPLGAGTNYGVAALTVYAGRLVAGGFFTTAGGSTANYIASWDGSTWRRLGTGAGMSDWVLALSVHAGQLYAGGSFNFVDGGLFNKVARWNGVSWNTLASGVNDVVHALTSYNGSLVVGGEFTAAGSTPLSRVARWSGTAWSPMGSGADDRAYALTPFHGELVAGGWFTSAGGTASPYWARWTDSNAPWVARQPQDVGGCGVASATFSVVAAPLGLPLTYRWRRGGTALNDAPGVITGAFTPTLTIISPTAADLGTYDCVVSSACGSAASAAATLSVRVCAYGPCAADFDGSGGTPDVGDVDAFFTAWLGGEECADVDCSGGTPDAGDIDAYFSLWLAGGCA